MLHFIYALFNRLSYELRLFDRSDWSELNFEDHLCGAFFSVGRVGKVPPIGLHFLKTK